MDAHLDTLRADGLAAGAREQALFPAGDAHQRRGGGYQTWVVILLSLNFGIVFLDRQGTAYMMPFIQPALHLSNTQVGVVSSALSFTWAIAGFLVGGLSDRLAARKPVVVLASAIFCLCSFISGAAGSFLVLLGARLLMGAAEGGIMPVSHAIIVSEVNPERRGLAMGIGQNLGSNLVANSLGPILFVAVATTWGWRAGFYLAAIPGLISAAIIWFTLREPPRESAGEAAHHPRTSLRQAFAHRNVALCAVISIAMVSYLVVMWAFLPLYLTKVSGFSDKTMSFLMAAIGLASGIGSFIMPSISDRFGRRPVIAIGGLVGISLPLAALSGASVPVLLVSIVIAGWGLNGVFPLFMATVPAESVDPRLAATLTGVVMGTGEVLGGVLSPALAGVAADAWGLAAPIWIMAAVAVIGGVLAIGLKESAPAVLDRRDRAVATLH